MSFLIASPEALAATATYLTGIGSAISAANAVAAAPTTEILAAGTDEVSTAISALFGAHAQAYQALSAHVAAFHDQFVHTLTAGAGSYMAAEAAAASPLQALQLELLNAINAPTLALLGRPLIGDGTDAAPGSGGAGGADKSSILADGMESLLGAIYLQHGMEKAREVILRLFGPLL
ncbi:PE domain-containing protein, partial [Mycobacterium tuberculosis variant caprae]|uniref:PE family protein n=1 Tax=Mycobacterium tuberculosis TaxID=1773 RepID=UPI002F95E423